MGGIFSVTRKNLAAALLVLVASGGVLFWQRGPLLAWYYLHGLAVAEDSERSQWAERVASLDEAALPGLIDLLSRDDARACANGEAALSALANRWGPADPRTAALAQELITKFASASAPGREAILEWHLALLHDLEGIKTTPKAALACANALLSAAANTQERDVRLRTLALAEVLLGCGEASNTNLCRDLAVHGLDSKDAETLTRGIRLVMHAPLKADKALLERVVPYLKDASPQVRRAAVLALGLAEETLAVQEMLPLLQDPDAEVRRLCETALRGRGLRDTHIMLAKLITDQRPSQRLQVVHYLNDAEDLEAGIWLLHLSQDPSPAVRAAAVRFAARDPAAADFQQRLLQMSHEDASPTVRQLAEFYLKTYQPRN